MELKRIIQEEIENYLSEIDWEGEFSDVKKTCIDPSSLVDYLNRVLANAPKKTKDREKFSKNKPYVHSKSSFFKKEEKEVDIEYFIKKITTPPKRIINQTEKISKTGNFDEFVYKTGIPALRGIVYDESQKKFFVINTCPGAGDCIFICYAMKGNYVRYPNAYDSMTRILNFLLNHPDKYKEQLYRELKDKCEEHEAYEDYESRVLVRWNDSGDFFSSKYVEIANSVINKLQKEGYSIDSYAYTKVADVASGDNFGSTKFSSGANKGQESKVKDSQQKSLIIPKDLFKNLNLKKLSHVDELKQIIANEYGFDKNTIISYRELITKPVENNPIWNVIVKPGDGDDAAMRNDVKNVLLVQH